VAQITTPTFVVRSFQCLSARHAGVIDPECLRNGLKKMCDLVMLLAEDSNNARSAPCIYPGSNRAALLLTSMYSTSFPRKDTLLWLVVWVAGGEYKSTSAIVNFRYRVLDSLTDLADGTKGLRRILHHWDSCRIGPSLARWLM